MNGPECVSAHKSVRAGDFALPGYLPATLRTSAVSLEIHHGDFLFQNGHPVTRLHFVAAGEIRLVEYAASGAECVLQRAGPGEWIGECSTCVDAYSCYARASRNSRVVALPMPLFTQVLHENLDFANAWASQLAVSLRRIFGRYERRSLKTARERVLHYLVTESHGRQYLDLAHSFAALAGELGLSRESLYRTLALLEREGAIQRDGKRLVVVPGSPAHARDVTVRRTAMDGLDADAAAPPSNR
jgi:CRP-like cAMP-binding protein